MRKKEFKHFHCLVPMLDYYQILETSSSAPPSDIKLAYHALLLQHHPDKNIRNSNPVPIDIALIKNAYLTLSSPISRAQYDASLNQRKQESLVPRPAQIVSLEDFTQIDSQGSCDRWEYPCRCGGSYRITETDMEKGFHLVGCRNCSEVIWAGYEVQEEEGQDTL
jgi:diphthamide biosynthesis protein 4